MTTCRICGDKIFDTEMSYCAECKNPVCMDCSEDEGGDDAFCPLCDKITDWTD